MNVIQTAKNHLERITPGDWTSQTDQFEKRKIMRAWFKRFLKKGSHKAMAYVYLSPIENDTLKVVAISGNGPNGIANANFIADAPEIVRGLLDLLREMAIKEYRARQQGNAAIQETIEEVEKLEREATIEKHRADGHKMKVIGLEQSNENLETANDALREIIHKQIRTITELKEKINNLTSTEFCKLNITNFPVSMKAGVEYMVVEKEDYEDLVAYNGSLKSDIEIWRKHLFEANERIKELEDTENNWSAKKSEADYTRYYKQIVDLQERNESQAQLHRERETLIDDLREQIKELRLDRCTCGWETNQCVEGEAIGRREELEKRAAEAEAKNVQQERIIDDLRIRLSEACTRHEKQYQKLSDTHAKEHNTIAHQHQDIRKQKTMIETLTEKLNKERVTIMGLRITMDEILIKINHIKSGGVINE